MREREERERKEGAVERDERERRRERKRGNETKKKTKKKRYLALSLFFFLSFGTKNSSKLTSPRSRRQTTPSRRSGGAGPWGRRWTRRRKWRSRLSSSPSPEISSKFFFLLRLGSISLPLSLLRSRTRSGKYLLPRGTRLKERERERERDEARSSLSFYQRGVIGDDVELTLWRCDAFWFLFTLLRVTFLRAREARARARPARTRWRAAERPRTGFPLEREKRDELKI